MTIKYLVAVSRKKDSSEVCRIVLFKAEIHVLEWNTLFILLGIFKTFASVNVFHTKIYQKLIIESKNQRFSAF